MIGVSNIHGCVCGFSSDEWEQLEPGQRNVYKDTKLENCNNPVSIGNQDPRQVPVSKLDGEEERCSSGKVNKNSPSSLHRLKKTGTSASKSLISLW